MIYNELEVIAGDDYVVNDKIKIRHPKLRDIKEIGQERYFAMLNVFISSPADCIAMLDDMGLDYEEVEDFTLFVMLSRNLDASLTNVLFGDLDFSKLKLAENEMSKQIALIDADSGIVIDKSIYEIISEYLRKIHGSKKNMERAGNAATKRFLIEDAKRKAKMPPSKTGLSLGQIIMKLTNTSGFKHDTFTIWDLPIYVFMSSLEEVQKNVYWNHLMQGVYSGNVDQKKIPSKELSWFKGV